MARVESALEGLQSHDVCGSVRVNHVRYASAVAVVSEGAIAAAAAAATAYGSGVLLLNIILSHPCEFFSLSPFFISFKSAQRRSKWLGAVRS